MKVLQKRNTTSVPIAIAWTLFFRFLAPRPIDTSILHDMVGDAFALAMVGFVLSMPVAKLYAQKYRCTIDSNQVIW